MNSFLLFSNEYRPKIAAANSELTNAAVSVLLGERWKALPLAERAVYVESARKIKDEFKLEHPEYRYARSTRTKKRKQQQSAAIAQAAAAMHAVPSREPDTAPMSLHALALAGASLAATSPRADAAPKGYFTHMGVAARPSPMSGGGGGEEEAEGGGPSEPAPSPRPPSAPAQDAAMGSRSSSFSMLDQLCHVADGVKRAA